jgi:hypothetical protein
MLPGTTIDRVCFDPKLREKTPPLVARLGPTELALLREKAERFGLTRSALARRLVVKGLLELRDRRAA